MRDDGDYEIIRESFSNLSSGDTLKAEWVGLTQRFTVHFEDSNQPIRGNGSLPTVVQPIAAPTAHSEAAPSEDLPALRITQVVEFAYDQRSFKNTVTVQNAGSTALDSVRYMRNVDPDQDFDTYGDFHTSNQITVQQTSDGEARVRAIGLTSGIGLSYFSTDARARVSTFGFTNMDPYDVAAYDHAGVYEWDGWTDANVYLSAKGSVTADQAITICADLGTIQPGQQQTFVYYTGFEAVPKYTIRASAGSGGTISPSGDITVYQGASESFDVHADTGYSIAGVLVDGAPVSLSSPTSMTYTFSNVAKNHTIAALFMRPDAMAPVIDLPDGVPQSAVGSPYDLHLVVTDDTSIADVGIFENGQRVGGSFTGGELRVRLSLPDGQHQLVIVAVDGIGNRTERAITLVVDTRPPVLTIDPPASVSTAMFTLTGSAVDAVSGLASLTINDEAVIPFLDGSFSVKLALVKGANAFVIEAVDRAGNITSQTFTVTYGGTSTAPSSIYAVLTIGSMDIEVNGMTRKMDAAPFIKDGRTLLPIRALIEALGGSVQWNPSTETATVMLGSRTVALTIGSPTALVNGTPITLDVAPMIVKGRTFLPLRAVAENIGLDLAWEPVSRTVSLTYWP